MRKLCVVLFLFSLMAVKSYGQSASALPPVIRASETLDNINELASGEVLYGIPQPEGKLIGDTYLNTNWMKSALLLYEKDKLLEGFPVRYDIQLDELEIKGKNGVKVLRGDKVKSFILVDSLSSSPKYFVNSREYKNEDGVPKLGFFQVLSDGALPLLKKTSITIKRGNYNVQFDVGSRDNKIIKKADFFILEGDLVKEISSSTKKLLPLFGEKSGEVEKFIKLNKLDVKQENHLKAIFDHYNSLVKKS